MADERVTLREVYSQYAASKRLDGPLGAVLDRLIDGSLNRASFDAIVKSHRAEQSARFRRGLLDMILHYIRRALKDHTLTADEHADLRYLATTFAVREGEFLRYWTQEIAAIRP